MKGIRRAGGGRRVGSGEPRPRPVASSGPRLVLVGCGRQSGALVAALVERGASAMALSVDGAGGATPEGLARLGPDTVVIGGAVAAVDPEIVSRIAEAVRAVGGVTLVLVEGASEGVAAGMLDAGADDVVAPPHSAAAILLRREIARSRAPADPSAGGPYRISLGSLELDPVSRGVHHGEAAVYLSTREFELLAALGAARGRAVRREALVDEVWGAEEATEAALDATVHRLRRRLRTDGFPRGIVETVRGVGYRIAAKVLRNGAT